MPEFADIYVLSRRRDAAAVQAFLEVFAAFRVVTTDEYEVPQYFQSPARIFRSAEQLIDYCCEHNGENHAIYWRISSGQASYAMVFFLSDSHVIYGLSVDAEKKDVVDQLRQAIVENVGSTEALIAWESPPPDSAVEFRKALSNGT